MAFGLVGCMTGEDGSALSSALSEGEAEPLFEVPRGEWQRAEAGCEDLLGDVAVYGIAERHPELIVGLGADMSLICVDSYHAVHEDLAELSRREEEVLRLRYHATLWNLGMQSEDESATAPEEMRALRTIALDEVKGDPMPQPNIVGDLWDGRYGEFLEDDD